MSFIEAIFRSDTVSGLPAVWRNHSTAKYHIFESDFGTVSLRKRTAYPATFAAVHGSTLYFGYGDGDVGQTIVRQPLAGVSETVFYDAEFLLVVADARMQTVTVQRDALSTLPLFAGTEPGRLVLSNLFEKVCELLTRAPLTLDAVALAEILTSLPTYDRTICNEIKLLYDRVRLTWSQGGHTIWRPAHAARLHNGQTPQSDIRQLATHLEGTITNYQRRYANGMPFGCDLSGGMDSALVVGYLRDSGHNPITSTMLLPGSFGEAQTSKITALHQRFTLNGIARRLDAERHYPLDFLAESGVRPFYHYQLFAHFGANDELLQDLAGYSVTSLFNGHGGDELCDMTADYRPVIYEDLYAHHQSRNRLQSLGRTSWTPAFANYFAAAAHTAQLQTPRQLPLVTATMANAMAMASPKTFDYNIWPVAPLANPGLYRYCQGLPIRYRHNRNLTRMYLQARRFPAIIYGHATEHFNEHYFAAVMQHLSPLLHHYLSCSVLAQYALIDAKALLVAFNQLRQLTYQKGVEDFVFKLVTILGLEINLQALGLHP